MAILMLVAPGITVAAVSEVDDVVEIDFHDLSNFFKPVDTSNRANFGLPTKAELGFTEATDRQNTDQTSNVNIFDNVQVRLYDSEDDLLGMPPTPHIDNSAILSAGTSITPSSISSSVDNDCFQLTSASPFFTEHNNGGHYFVFSPVLNSYTSVYTMVTLPTTFNNASHSRNAYISLGIYGSTANAHGIDMGISNEGDGWAPYYRDVGVGSFRFAPSNIAPSTAVYAEITCRAVSASCVRIYVGYLDSSGNDVGTALGYDVPIATGNIQIVNGTPKCRFYRFGSFVPLGTDNRHDGSFVIGCKLKYCKLFNISNSNNTVWDLANTSVTERAWVMYPANVALYHSNGDELFSIFHG